MLTFTQIEHVHGDHIYVSAFADEPINLVRPREDVNAKLKTSKGTIVITVKYLGQDDNSREMRCKMTQTMCFDKFISLYSKRWGIDPPTQHLTFNGKTVFPSDTPVSVSHILFLIQVVVVVYVVATEMHNTFGALYGRIPRCNASLKPCI